MNWDWEKLQNQQRQRRGPIGGGPPNLDDFSEKFKQFRNFKLPGGKLLILGIVVLWLLTGIFMVGPAERGVIKRFGEFNRETGPGLHYHMPYPIESVLTLNVDQVRRIEIGFRSASRDRDFQQGQTRSVEDESLMLTGDENIVDVQFSVQYQIADARSFLFNVDGPDLTVKAAAEAAMREIIGKNRIDAALTSDKQRIMDQTQELMQHILDMYKTGILLVNLQMQNVHPPNEVIDAFKDVVSAREDRDRLRNEAEAYRRDILPKAKGRAEAMLREAEAFQAMQILGAEGDASRFKAVADEYRKAPEVTRTRLFLETMEQVLSNPETEKLILSDEALEKSVPYLPLGQLPRTPQQRQTPTQQGGTQ